MMKESTKPYLVAQVCLAAIKTERPVLINDLRANKSSSMNSQVYRAILLAQIQPKGLKVSLDDASFT